MKVLRTALVAMAIMASGASPSFAQGGHGASMSDMGMKNMGPLQKASIEAMDKMNKAMMQGMMASDADVAWICAMIPHHQGAVAMAQVGLKNGDDAEAKKIAEKTVREQEKSIAELKSWLERHDTKASGGKR